MVSFDLKFGLTERDWKEILKPFCNHKEIERVVIFGSRAKGTHKERSDIDLALYGRDINLDTLGAVQNYLNEETILPYQFDILHYEKITNPLVKEHIDLWGKEVYKR